MWGKRQKNFPRAFTLFSILTQLFDVSYATTSDKLVYAPSLARCPTYFVEDSGNIFAASSNDSSYSDREAIEISQVEKAWIKGKNEKTTPNLIEWFKNLDMEDYSDDDVSKFINSLDYDINIALAFSGGGYRAMLTGAGQIAALDNNTNYHPSNKSSPSINKLGGLLQASSYFSALSGGSWLLSSLVFDDWTSVQDILDGKTEIWNLTTSILDQTTNISYFTNLISLAAEKQEAGIGVNASLVDVYGIYISSVLFANKPNGGLNLTWSGIRDMESFNTFEMPYPIIATIGGNTDEVATYYANLFEVSPFEIGSWVPQINSFTDTKYFGSRTDDMGRIMNGLQDNCTVHFDTATFLLASSSNIFPAFFYPNGSVMPQEGGEAETFASDIAELALLIDTALSPVPFGIVPGNLAANDFSLITGEDYGFVDNSSTFSQEVSYLIDGGSFDEGIPIDPFLQPTREVDVIFAFDSSDNTEDNWPNATTLQVTSERLTFLGSSIKFYDVPDDFAAAGLTGRPTFFGCNGSKLLSAQNEASDLVRMTPILIYIPNSDLSFASNVSTLKLSYTDEEKYGMIENGFNTATRLNYTLDSEFAECVGCAILRRGQERMGIEQESQCLRCFERYCYIPDDYTEEADGDVIPETSEDLAAFSSGIASSFTYNSDIFAVGTATASGSGTATGSTVAATSGSVSSSSSSSSASAPSTQSSKGAATSTYQLSTFFLSICLLLVSLV